MSKTNGQIRSSRAPIIITLILFAVMGVNQVLASTIKDLPRMDVITASQKIQSGEILLGANPSDHTLNYTQLNSMIAKHMATVINNMNLISGKSTVTTAGVAPKNKADAFVTLDLARLLVLELLYVKYYSMAIQDDESQSMKILRNKTAHKGLVKTLHRLRAGLLAADPKLSALLCKQNDFNLYLFNKLKLVRVLEEEMRGYQEYLKITTCPTPENFNS